MSCDTLSTQSKQGESLWGCLSQSTLYFLEKRLILFHDVLQNTKLVYGVWHSGLLYAHNSISKSVMCVFYVCCCMHMSREAGTCREGHFSFLTAPHVIRLDEVWHILHDAVKGHLYWGKAQNQCPLRIRDKTHKGKSFWYVVAWPLYLCSLKPGFVICVATRHWDPSNLRAFLTHSWPSVMT